MSRFSSQVPASKAPSVPSKKFTNISLSTEVYLEATGLGIDVSQLCEQTLREEIHALKASSWNEQHADFIAVYNKTVEAEGVALQDWRPF